MSARIFTRCSALGSWTAYRLGILRKMAASMSFGRLVAPRTRFGRWRRGDRPRSLDDLSLRKESISSINMIHSCTFLARLKRPATSLLDSPNHLLVRTETAMLTKVAPDSFAMALEGVDLPHPGGP